MSSKHHPRQLVLRRDTATGLTHVGWETDMPVGRFEHLVLICESEVLCMPEPHSEHYGVYCMALQRARALNAELLDEQIHQYLAKGWQRVPFELATDPQVMRPDDVGNYTSAAMQLHYQLTHNRRQAWAVTAEQGIVHIRPRNPSRQLDTLTYQVWYHRQLQELQSIGGRIEAGILLVAESGLWFIVV
jgi:hypothetical protein